MSVIDPSAAVPAEGVSYCRAECEDTRPCRQRALWRVEHVAHGVYGHLCEVHRRLFAAAYPLARVQYMREEVGHDGC